MFVAPEMLAMPSEKATSSPIVKSSDMEAWVAVRLVVVKSVLFNVPIDAEVMFADKASKSSLTDTWVNRFSIEVKLFKPVNIPPVKVAMPSVIVPAFAVSVTVKESDKEARTPTKLSYKVNMP